MATEKLKINYKTRL